MEDGTIRENEIHRSALELQDQLERLELIHQHGLITDNEYLAEARRSAGLPAAGEIRVVPDALVLERGRT
jgi:hypothetical protein